MINYSQEVYLHLWLMELKSSEFFWDKKIHIAKFRSRPLKEREYTDLSVDNSIYALDDRWLLF